MLGVPMQLGCLPALPGLLMPSMTSIEACVRKTPGCCCKEALQPRSRCLQAGACTWPASCLGHCPVRSSKGYLHQVMTGATVLCLLPAERQGGAGRGSGAGRGPVAGARRGRADIDVSDASGDEGRPPSRARGRARAGR